MVPKIRQATVRQEGGTVQLVVDGQLILDVSWEQALKLGQALIFQARKAEEFTKADQVIKDQALLLRAGIPLGLATDPRMMQEAGKEAAWNSDLRRYMPNNLEKIEQYGTVYPPTVVQEEPEEK
jgi:hypothetical protein